MVIINNITINENVSKPYVSEILQNPISLPLREGLREGDYQHYSNPLPFLRRQVTPPTWDLDGQ
jgi:hypothetical protein